MAQRSVTFRIAGILAAILAGLLILVTFVSAAAYPANDTFRPGKELPLNGCLNGCDLNQGVDGYLYVSDYDAGELWRIQPASGVYTLYQVSGRPVDGKPDGAGNIWWTDGAESFSRLSLATGQQTTWVFSNFESFSGVAFDQAGQVWFAESFGSTSRLHQFDPDTNELCGYDFGGIYSYYLLFSQGYFWSLNWFQEEIVRFDPATLSVQRWIMGDGIRDPLGMAMDQDDHLWWTDRTGRLYRLEPDEDRQTRYELPAGKGSVVEMIEARDGLIWYSESVSGTIGALDPAATAGISSTLGVSSDTATGTCSTLSPEADVAATIKGGSISWSDISLNTLQDQDGWVIFQLPEGAEPLGLAAAAGAQWATDVGRQQLVRFDLNRDGQLYLDVSADPGQVYHGGAISYTYQVTYTSVDNSPAQDVTVVDDTCAPVTYTAGDGNGDQLLDVTETWIYSCDHTMPAHASGEANPLLNMATLTGKDADGVSVAAAQDGISTTIRHRIGALSITKVGPPSAGHGQRITFSYTLNYSATDLAPAINISVTDNLCTPVIGPVPGGDANQDSALDVGETWIFLCEFTVPAHQDQEEDSLVNTATVEGQNLDGLDLNPSQDQHETDIIHLTENEYLYLPLIMKG